MTEKLQELIRKARNHTMTPEERQAQAISFAYGNLAIDRPEVTREDIRKVYEQIHSEHRPEAPAGSD